ncbi:rifin [Plasmodium sp. gorilla clade G1]|nr:rifin [Plasmodium sp. gorilla clade G1]
MKVHYINILMFALPLNILVSSKKNPYITHNTPSTKAIRTPRTLCECEWYTPSNYDNDPEMKFVMENYNRQASERFKEYDERMNKNRKKCKEQCDKEIQKIILKEKIEKELTEKFATLDTNISTNDIPTCVCEKSLADKAENFCLKCGYELGGGVLQSFSLLGGISEVALSAWKAAELVTAEELAVKAGVVAGEAARMPAAIKAVISGLKLAFPIDKLRFGSFESLINEKTYADVVFISDIINSQYTFKCPTFGKVVDDSVCTFFEKLGHVEGSSYVNVLTKTAIRDEVTKVVTGAKTTAEAAVKKAIDDTTATFTAQNTGAVNTTYTSCQTAIIASIVAILVIVFVMMIIYLILRYRRKKKMKKKLQYIKLLKE